MGRELIKDGPGMSEGEGVWGDFFEGYSPNSTYLR